MKNNSYLRTIAHKRMSNEVNGRIFSSTISNIPAEVIKSMVNAAKNAKMSEDMALYKIIDGDINVSENEITVNDPKSGEIMMGCVLL